MYNEDHKTGYHFSPGLDNEFLQELYGDDIQQAELVFETSVQQLRTEQQLAEARFHDGDLPGLRKVIHKMKPLLGYIGLNKYLEEFSLFENTCMQSASVTDAETGFYHIKVLTSDAIRVAEQEMTRLKQHNTQYL